MVVLDAGVVCCAAAADDVVRLFLGEGRAISVSMQAPLIYEVFTRHFCPCGLLPFVHQLAAALRVASFGIDW